MRHIPGWCFQPYLGYCKRQRCRIGTSRCSYRPFSERDGERMMDVTSSFLKGVIERATFLEPRTAKGALFQLCVLSDLVDELEGCVTSKAWAGNMETLRTPQDAEASKLQKKINRMLHSLASYIEATCGVKREDACGDYFLPRHLSEHILISEALALVEADQ